ncbi:hypothetical protein Hanom_Chr02g00156601 [Helianthus anomalus]
MLYAVMESHLKIDVHAAFNELEVKRAEDRRIERERRLVEEAKQKNKSVIEEFQEAAGFSSQVDVEMTEAKADPLGVVLVGESSESLDLTDILHQVHVLQKKKKAREVLMLKWKVEKEVEEVTPNFILIGKASSVPYSIKEIVRQIKVKERRRKAKIARGEIFYDGSDKELFGDEEEDEDDNDDDDKSDKKNDEDDKKNDDDQGSFGLLVENPNVQHMIEEFLNDEINEQEDDLHHEASTAEKLEELGLNDGKFKFDIEDEIPPSPEREFEFSNAHEANHYNHVIVEDVSDSSDEETDFHYSGVDETFPSLAEMFKDRNEDEIRRKIVEKISSEGVPKTIPR